MKKLTLLSFILLSILFSLYSCKTPQTLATTSLSGNDTVKVGLKDTAYINVIDNPSTGYKWFFDANSGSKIISYQGDFYTNPKPQVIGAAGTRTFKFYAKKPGVTTIKLFKKRNNQAPIDSMTVLIVIEK
ncbi:MAG: protease inhibitor I42 family protein [Bacteroidales bacterium]|nr:protease inhibitor I42 family protein [Bacteroidales bacterium]